MTVATDAQRLAWVAQWRAAAVALERIRLTELAVADLGRIAADLDDACLAASRARGHEPGSGLVTQQRLLQLGRVR